MQHTHIFYFILFTFFPLNGPKEGNDPTIFTDSSWEIPYVIRSDTIAYTIVFNKNHDWMLKIKNEYKQTMVKINKVFFLRNYNQIMRP